MRTSILYWFALYNFFLAQCFIQL